MLDVHSPDQRSYNMSCIRGKDTKPEKIVRQLLWQNGYRYRLHRKDLPGKPDIVFSGRRKVIFVNGCFWHRHDCKYFKWPKTNQKFWKEKIKGTQKRDQSNQAQLTEGGWRYLIIWECETKPKDLSGLFRKINNFLSE